MNVENNIKKRAKRKSKYEIWETKNEEEINKNKVGGWKKRKRFNTNLVSFRFRLYFHFYYSFIIKNTDKEEQWWNKWRTETNVILEKENWWNLRPWRKIIEKMVWRTKRKIKYQLINKVQIWRGIAKAKKTIEIKNKEEGHKEKIKNNYEINEGSRLNKK